MYKLNIKNLKYSNYTIFYKNIESKIDCISVDRVKFHKITCYVSASLTKNDPYRFREKTINWACYFYHIVAIW